jgi:hypothetical protein
MSSFTVESWTWCAVTLCMILARYVARLWHFRFKISKLMVEDWFMAFLTGLYIVLIAFLNVDHDVSTNLIDPNDPIQLTPEEIAKRTWGSKTVLLVEQSMCAVQWGTKGCLLILYWRITHNLRQHLAVKLVAVYVVSTYCIMFILYFGVWCRPFHDYWAVPTDNVQCTTALNHLITNLTFNLSSDLMIIAIPLPLLLKQHLAFKKKLLMIFPFTLGFFSMICAILSKYSSFTNPFSVAWVYWYCREASTVMIVTNMPYAWALIRRIFKLRSFFGDSEQDVVQDGNVREYQGQSVRTRTLGSVSRPKSKSWWRKSSAAKQRPMDSSENEMVSRTKSNAEDGNGHLGDPASSDVSVSGGSVQKPPPARTATDAVDKMYNLDLEDEELVRTDTMRRLGRGYNPE